MATIERESRPPRPSGDRQATPPSTKQTRDADPDRTQLKTVAIGALLGYLALAVTLTACGALVVHLLDETWIVDLDHDATRWLARHRSEPFDSLTALFSRWANTWPIVIGATGTVLVLASLRAWRSAATLFLGLLLEITVFLSVSWTVGRPRPSVEHLSSVPATASFPSGHAAASVALYGGWVLLIRSIGRVGWVTHVAAGLAALVPVAVAVSRVYRGLHHPLDVTAGAALGLACLAVATVVTRPLPDRLADDVPVGSGANHG